MVQFYFRAVIAARGEGYRQNGEGTEKSGAARLNATKWRGGRSFGGCKLAYARLILSRYAVALQGGEGVFGKGQAKRLETPTWRGGCSFGGCKLAHARSIFSQHVVALRERGKLEKARLNFAQYSGRKRSNSSHAHTRGCSIKLFLVRVGQQSSQQSSSLMV